MNFAIRTRQLARVYIDAQSLVVAPDALARLVESARLGERMNAPVVLPLPVLDPKLPPGSAPRFMLASPTLEWQLGLFAESFDLHHLPTDFAGTNIGDLREFATRAAAALWDSAQFFGRTPHRLVLAQNGMLGEMDNDTLDAIARRLLRLPARNDDRAPFEWDWRCANAMEFAIGGRGERVNSIATIKRIAGALQSGNDRLPFDRIQVELDINTAPDDARGRFDAEATRQFFMAAVDEHARLSAELTALALGGA